MPHRGKTNEPAFVIKVAEMLAELWSLGIEDVAETTTRSFEELFRVSVIK